VKILSHIAIYTAPFAPSTSEPVAAAQLKTTHDFNEGADHGEARHGGRGLLTGSLRRCGHVVLGAVAGAPSAVTQAHCQPAA
jgi:hypothetical protein